MRVPRGACQREDSSSEVHLRARGQTESDLSGWVRGAAHSEASLPRQRHLVPAAPTLHRLQGRLTSLGSSLSLLPAYFLVIPIPLRWQLGKRLPPKLYNRGIQTVDGFDKKKLKKKYQVFSYFSRMVSLPPL